MKILFVSHELSRTGAPYVLHEWIQYVRKTHPEWVCALATLHDGSRKQYFEQLLPVHVLYSPRKNILHRLLDLWRRKKGTIEPQDSRWKKILSSKKWDVIYFNSAATYRLFQLSIHHPAKKWVHIHELEATLMAIGRENILPFHQAEGIIAVAQAVKNCLVQQFDFHENTVHLVYEFGTFNFQDVKHIGHPFTVGGGGTQHVRKGFDLFLSTAVLCQDISPQHLQFGWMGKAINDFDHALYTVVHKNAQLHDRVKLWGELTDTSTFYGSIHVLFLSSIEDPFPLVCLEAIAQGIPIICFDHAGGIPELVRAYDCGWVVPYLDILSVRSLIFQLIENPEMIIEKGKKAREAAPNFATEIQGEKILKLIS